MALEKKYYSGSQVFDIIKELPGKEFMSMLNAFAKERGADVVEVVRCRDCVHRHQTTCPFLIANAYKASSDDDFCSRGKRRENG